MIKYSLTVHWHDKILADCSLAVMCHCKEFSTNENGRREGGCVLKGVDAMEKVAIRCLMKEYRCTLFDGRK